MDLQKTAIGLEFGSTRIKAVLIDANHAPIAQGSFDWENRLENGVWTYHEDEIFSGLQAAFADLMVSAQSALGHPLSTTGCIGFSAMMHGYLALDADGRLLTPFRTWRNTMTRDASARLTDALGFNMPQRWSVSHLYQAILNREEHLPRLNHLTTLAGFVHRRLTGRNVLGIGDASGMFPVDAKSGGYDAEKAAIFDRLAAEHGFGRKLTELLPTVLRAGDDAGTLTESGALLLDPSGVFQAGVPLCPPEGDAGTGMTATNSVLPRTGNVSAGTSIFAMVVLENPLPRVHEEIDIVATPAGDPVAMVHCNNCTSDLNAWAELLEETLRLHGVRTSRGELLTTLFRHSLSAETDAGGILPINYFSGEGVTHLDAGMPLLLRRADCRWNLANLFRGHIYSGMATLALGLEILRNDQVCMDALVGHGGLFKTPGVAQRYLSAAAEAPVTVTSTAGEGGAWGMALLAAYRLKKTDGMTLADYLNKRVFAEMAADTVMADQAEIDGFRRFLSDYRKALEAEKAAVKAFLA